MSATRTALTAWIETGYLVMEILTGIVLIIPLLLLWEIFRQNTTHAQ